MESSNEPLDVAEPEEPLDPAEEADGVPSLDPADALRGELFTGLDRLAFALELEAAEALEAGREEAVLALENQRLGVRLAQRLVAGVYAVEVDPRIEDTRTAYDRRTGPAADG